MKRALVSGAAAIGALALAACGQGDQNKATAPVEATPAATESAAASTPVPADDDALAPGTGFHAVSTVPCALTAAQPMGQCEAGVIRNTDGTAVVRVSWPDGRSRNLFFDQTGATGADISEADGPHVRPFKVEKVDDLYKIALGTQERYEVPEVLVVGE